MPKITKATGLFSGFFKPVLDFLFPPGKSVQTVEKIAASGPAELRRLLPASEPGNSDVESGGRVFSLFAYSDERVKHLVWEIKYYRNQRIAEAVGFLLAEEIRQQTRAKNQTGKFPGVKFLVVPIPLTHRRLHERGFNHTEMLAQAVLKFLPAENFEFGPEILRKIRHTPKQSSLEDRGERFKNLVGAFQVVDPTRIRDRKILIIDDVTTTGATLAEAKMVLLAAGASEVRAFTVAH